jgi:hypothetical protein
MVHRQTFTWGILQVSGSYRSLILSYEANYLLSGISSLCALSESRPEESGHKLLKAVKSKSLVVRVGVYTPYCGLALDSDGPALARSISGI